MRVVVTGAAGFVGSHLVEALAARGDEVVAVDCLLSDSYSAAIKAENLQSLAGLPGVECRNVDLRTDDLAAVVAGADAVVNEAAMPGLMKSWTDFDVYVGCNLLAVERLLVAVERAGVGRIVQISTSSVYGRFAVGDENLPTEPFSPYGVSKLAAEKLVLAHVANFGLDAVILRYFSLYGPRQRPDMGYHLFCEAMLDGRPITVFGDGRQRRSNTYVSDAVSATVAALDRGSAGDVVNICGDETVELLDAIAVLADELGVEPILEFAQPRPGDQRDTSGDATRARRILRWSPQVPVDVGLRRQAAWHAARRT
ncbi:MAG TPA: NAD-dependent epimerase/dehydratase family protein [Actinomycetota bacterium]|nr:MAG: NAD-dependent epimerase/dehydratase family protein [Actinomycetota bacterium]HNE88535.1 NAD-dependent epimerase/dehydratase family protein [Actinomycetota bacterium]HNL50612.1 NAD-dependent epimerase/dehydratase family protein [Actinomycetota bacterium]HNO15477.1 NAD-dependent epimerase/dehydratase family protein [Actinomycetota bacterium]HUM86777.1 NAD-dependent epimerase/dehydratase family protein [Actinomycetota bacterium]